jgi:hypothetical protein
MSRYREPPTPKDTSRNGLYIHYTCVGDESHQNRSIQTLHCAGDECHQNWSMHTLHVCWGRISPELVYAYITRVLGTNVTWTGLYRLYTCVGDECHQNWSIQTLHVCWGRFSPELVYTYITRVLGTNLTWTCLYRLAVDWGSRGRAVGIATACGLGNREVRVSSVSSSYSQHRLLGPLNLFPMGIRGFHPEGKGVKVFPVTLSPTLCRGRNTWTYTSTFLLDGG